MVFDLEFRAIQQVVGDEPGMYSNYCLEGDVNKQVEPYAFACIYPMRAMSYVFLQVGEEDIDLKAHRDMIMGFALREEIARMQQPVIETWKDMSKPHMDFAISLYSESLEGMHLPFTFIMFAKTHPGEGVLAVLYHPFEFPSSDCLEILKQAVSRREASDN